MPFMAAKANGGFVGKLVIKVQLGDDLRRMLIHNEELTYDELILMMQHVFKPNLDCLDGLTVKYKDEDGEYVTIAEDSDLFHAICLGKTLRMKLIVPRAYKSPANEVVGDENVARCELDFKSLHTEVNHLRDDVDKLLKKFDQFVQIFKQESKANCHSSTTYPVTEVQSGSFAQLETIPMRLMSGGIEQTLPPMVPTPSAASPPLMPPPTAVRTFGAPSTQLPQQLQSTLLTTSIQPSPPLSSSQYTFMPSGSSPAFMSGPPMPPNQSQQQQNSPMPQPSQQAGVVSAASNSSFPFGGHFQPPIPMMSSLSSASSIVPPPMPICRFPTSMGLIMPQPETLQSEVAIQQTPLQLGGPPARSLGANFGASMPPPPAFGTYN